jgi:hypothetical protein
MDLLAYPPHFCIHIHVHKHTHTLHCLTGCPSTSLMCSLLDFRSKSARTFDHRSKTSAQRHQQTDTGSRIASVFAEELMEQTLDSLGGCIQVAIGTRRLFSAGDPTPRPVSQDWGDMFSSSRKMITFEHVFDRYPIPPHKVQNSSEHQRQRSYLIKLLLSSAKCF